MEKFLVILLISLVSGDTSVTVNLKNGINSISDKFISNQVNFYELMSLMKENGNFTMLSPSYFKLENFLDYLREFDGKNHGEVEAFFQALQ